MRRWPLLERLLREDDPQDRGRCILVVEELEAREVLSPVVTSPFFMPPLRSPEGATVVFSGSPSTGGTSFSVSDTDNTGQSYGAVLSSPNGTILIDEEIALDLGLTLTNNGTSAVTFSFRLTPEINSFLVPKFTFTPTAFYSGDASVSLTVTDPDGPSDTGQLSFKVDPVASDASVTLNSSGEVLLPSAPFDFPPGFVSVSQWPDADGSEILRVFFSLSAPDPTLFTLSAGGAVVAPVEPGQWQLFARTAAEFQALMDSVVLTPPAGFTGRVSLSMFATIRDQAFYPSDGSTASDSNFAGGGYAQLRFFVGGNVSLPPVAGVEGGTLDLGGRFVASDPDYLDGDSHTLTLSVPNGTLALNPAAVPAGLSVVQNTGTLLVLSGSLAAINQFLATPGSLTYTAADPDFSGVVPLTVTLVNNPGEPFSEEMPKGSQSSAIQSASPVPFAGVAALSFAPAADGAVPFAQNVVTNQGKPVVLMIGVSPLADADGSESVLIILEGVPAGAKLNRGTNLGNGQWALLPADLPGLTFAPPGQPGIYTLTVKVVVTDSAPAIGMTDTKVTSTTFTIQVNPSTPQLPPNVADDVIANFAGPIVIDGTVVEDETGEDDEADDNPDPEPDPQAQFAGYTGWSGDMGLGSTETRVSLAPPGPGSLFSQSETPLPTYAYGEKHPLPSVLPLDQTLPVAGFTESGGDSIALIDKLYRDADNAERPVVTLIMPAGTQPIVTEEAPAERTVPVVAGIAGNVAIPGAADPASQNWYLWGAAAGVATIAGCLLRSRGYGGPVARGFRRIFCALFNRQPTEGNA